MAHFHVDAAVDIKRRPSSIEIVSCSNIITWCRSSSWRHIHRRPYSNLLLWNSIRLDYYLKKENKCFRFPDMGSATKCCRWRHYFLDLIRVEKRFELSFVFHWIRVETRTDGVNYFVQSPHHFDAEKKLHCCIWRRAWIERDDISLANNNRKKNRPTSGKKLQFVGVLLCVVAGSWKFLSGCRTAFVADLFLIFRGFSKLISKWPNFGWWWWWSAHIFNDCNFLIFKVFTVIRTRRRIWSSSF